MTAWQSLPERLAAYLGAACLTSCSLQDFDQLSAGLSSGSGGQTASGGSGSPATSGGAAGSGASSAFGTGETGGAGPVGNESLVNGSFEDDLAGWTLEPPDVRDRYAFVQWPVAGSTTVDGQREFSTWSESVAYQVTLSQALVQLDDGEYVFAGHFNHGSGQNAAYLFARGCGGADLQADVPPTLRAQWLAAELRVEVSGGRCEVGLFVDANPSNWLNADLFTFEKSAP